jgi:AcrR family transcriptional regulator
MPRTGRRPGPSSTREQIVTAAAGCFATAGYDATSVRQVAAAAGVDPALVRRFFGDKEQLFTEFASTVIDPERAVAVVADGPADSAGERLVGYYLRLLGDVEQPGPMLGLIRSAVTSEHAATLLRQFLAERVLGRIAATLHADQPELRAALAASQLVGLAITRYAVQLPALTAAEPADVTRWVAPVVQYYLTRSHIC